MATLTLIRVLILWNLVFNHLFSIASSCTHHLCCHISISYVSQSMFNYQIYTVNAHMVLGLARMKMCSWTLSPPRELMKIFAKVLCFLLHYQVNTIIHIIFNIFLEINARHINIYHDISRKLFSHSCNTIDNGMMIYHRSINYRTHVSLYKYWLLTLKMPKPHVYRTSAIILITVTSHDGHGA